MEILQLAVAELEAPLEPLKLALAISGLPSSLLHRTVTQWSLILQLAVAEAPLEPCSWLWPYFWALWLSAAYLL